MTVEVSTLLTPDRKNIYLDISCFWLKGSFREVNYGTVHTSLEVRIHVTF